jgi:hypothetical protein
MINASVRENGKEKNIGEFERRILYMTLLKTQERLLLLSE